MVAFTSNFQGKPLLSAEWMRQYVVTFPFPFANVCLFTCWTYMLDSSYSASTLALWAGCVHVAFSCEHYNMIDARSLSRCCAITSISSFSLKFFFIRLGILWTIVPFETEIVSGMWLPASTETCLYKWSALFLEAPLVVKCSSFLLHLCFVWDTNAI